MRGSVRKNVVSGPAPRLARAERAIRQSELLRAREIKNVAVHHDSGQELVDDLFGEPARRRGPGETRPAPRIARSRVTKPETPSRPKSRGQRSRESCVVPEYCDSSAVRSRGATPGGNAPVMPDTLRQICRLRE